MTTRKKSKAYWDKRRKAEKEWQKSVEKDVKKYNQKLTDMYNQAITDLNQQIKADLALSEGKLIKAEGMKEYESLAKRAVAKATAMRAKGYHVTRKDFSKDVNDRLKVYNATMRINRNEIIKSKIGARLVELGVDQEESLTNKLWNDYTKEKERQAGILGITTKSNLWTSKEVQEQIAKQVAGANFSKRIWADMDGLKGQLDGLLSSAIIRGESPQATAKWLTGMVSATVHNQRYAAERLARTETARVQFMAQRRSIIDNGFKYVEWIAEAKACKVCREIADQDSDEGRGIYKVRDVPDIPVHPNCMCSISAYWPDDKSKSSKNSSLTDDDVKALNYYISAGSYIINDELRKGNWSKSVQDKVIPLDNALNKMPVYEEKEPLQRDYFFSDNESMKKFAQQMKSKFFKDKAYISASKGHYGEGKEQIHVIIKNAKTGRDISTYNSNEQEVVFPRNTEFKIIDSYINKKGILTIVWEQE